MKAPRWTRSIRFRLAGMYTLGVFGLAVLVVGSIYFAFSRTLEGKPVSGDLQVRRVTSDRGVAIYLDEGGVEQLELLANQRALEKLRTMSLISLAVLFPASLGTGWVVAGRVLRPVGKITQVARDIEASDLSRRIDLEGPNDELKRLADTFDGMLGRIEGGVEDQRRFIQDISHELRNPLATMATSIDVALSDPHADARSLRETVKVVRRSVDRLTRSVADLTRFARQELPDSVNRAVRLGALAREVIEEFRVPAEARRRAPAARREYRADGAGRQKRPALRGGQPGQQRGSFGPAGEHGVLRRRLGGRVGLGGGSGPGTGDPGGRAHAGVPAGVGAGSNPHAPGEAGGAGAVDRAPGGRGEWGHNDFVLGRAGRVQLRDLAAAGRRGRSGGPHQRRNPPRSGPPGRLSPGLRSGGLVPSTPNAGA